MSKCPVCKEGNLKEAKDGKDYTLFVCDSCKVEIPIAKEYLKMIKKPTETI